jgi:hypothetical protein
MPIQRWIKQNSALLGSTLGGGGRLTVSDSYERRQVADFNKYSWAEFEALPRAEKISCYARYRIDQMIHQAQTIQGKLDELSRPSTNAR